MGNRVRRTIELSAAAVEATARVRETHGFRTDSAAIDYAIRFAGELPDCTPQALKVYAEICAMLGQATNNGGSIVIKYPDREERVFIVGLPKPTEQQLK